MLASQPAATAKLEGKAPQSKRSLTSLLAAKGDTARKPRP
jgi:hypothetical protein